MSVILEVRAAEGGQESRSLVREQLGVYLSLAARERL
jgi:protein subunit release factor A